MLRVAPPPWPVLLLPGEQPAPQLCAQRYGTLQRGCVRAKTSPVCPSVCPSFLTLNFRRAALTKNTLQNPINPKLAPPSRALTARPVCRPRGNENKRDRKRVSVRPPPLTVCLEREDERHSLLAEVTSCRQAFSSPAYPSSLERTSAGRESWSRSTGRMPRSPSGTVSRERDISVYSCAVGKGLFPCV